MTAGRTKIPAALAARHYDASTESIAGAIEAIRPAQAKEAKVSESFTILQRITN